MPHFLSTLKPDNCSRKVLNKQFIIPALKRIIISRTDNLGDVILTLPMAGILKSLFHEVEILFLGKTYTQPVISSCLHVDRFINKNDLSVLSDCEQIAFFRDLDADCIIHVFPDREISYIARKAGIPLRIGTSHRWYHFINCNKLVNAGRKKSNLHEAQLNLKLLAPLGGKPVYLPEEIIINYGIRVDEMLKDEILSLISGTKTNIILHPRSKGSAREWGLDNFSRLIHMLPEEHFNIFVTGTGDEGEQIRHFLTEHSSRVNDLTGKLTLHELISFIDRCDALVAASTGVLHIAAALGIYSVGLYAPMRPIFPTRWGPLGKKANYLVLDRKCNDCRKTNDCICIRSIKPEDVAARLFAEFRNITD